MNDFGYEINKHVAVLSTDNRGWNKELNVVRWNVKEPKLDIREWNPEHTMMSRGTILTIEEAVKLRDGLNEYLEEFAHEVCVEKLKALPDEEQLRVYNEIHDGPEIHPMCDLDEVTEDMTVSMFLADMGECFNPYENYFMCDPGLGWVSNEQIDDFIDWSGLPEEELAAACEEAGI